jgi:hypothetical protein
MRKTDRAHQHDPIIPSDIALRTIA